MVVIRKQLLRKLNNYLPKYVYRRYLSPYLGILIIVFGYFLFDHLLDLLLLLFDWDHHSLEHFYFFNLQFNFVFDFGIGGICEDHIYVVLANIILSKVCENNGSVGLIIPNEIGLGGDVDCYFLTGV